jgi:hypothetical protein
MNAILIELQHNRLLQYRFVMFHRISFRVAVVESLKVNNTFLTACDPYLNGITMKPAYTDVFRVTQPLDVSKLFRKAHNNIFEVWIMLSYVRKHKVFWCADKLHEPE